MPGISAIGRGRGLGFTLIELLVVMAILALLSTALPMALDRAIPSRRVASTSQKWIAALGEARMKSAACSCPVSLRLGDVSTPRSTRIKLTDADGLSIDAVQLFPDGSTNGARLEIVDGRRRGIVTIGPVTGRIAFARTP